MLAMLALGSRPRQPEEARHRSPSVELEAPSSRAPSADRNAGKVEFVPRSVEAEEPARPKKPMPMLPLHLIRGDHDPAAQEPGMTMSMSMHTTQSMCSADIGSDIGGGFSDTASMASLAFGGSSAGELPPALRSGELPGVPDCFKCKLSHQVMEDPVRLPDGSVCERANIAALQAKGQVKSDPVLAEAIRSYFELRKESERQQKEWQAWLAGRSTRAQEKLVQRQRQIYALRVALEQSRRRVQMLEEKNMASCKTASTTASSECSHREDVASDVVDPFSMADGGSPTTGQEAAAPQWRSGPAPRSEATTPATTKANERRRSTWSFLSGKVPSP